jgi:hypothetical protein
MSEMDNFRCILQSMQEDVDQPTRKAWKTWHSIQNYYQPTDTTASRDLRMALQKIKLKKDVNPMKIMSQISAVEVKFKQFLSKEKKVEVVQGSAGDNYAHIILVTDGLSQIESKWNAAALKLCKAMRKAWRIKGHDNDQEEDNDANNDILGWETSLGTVKDRQSSVRKKKCFDCGQTGHRSAKCPNKKKKG